MAENLLLKQQLTIHSHSRQRPPNLSTPDGVLLDFFSVFMNPRRIARRELLDQVLFWTVADLENKLRYYQAYFNDHRCHSGKDGSTPAQPDNDNVISLNNYRWKKHCRGLFQLSLAV